MSVGKGALGVLLLALLAIANADSSWGWSTPIGENYLYYSYAAYCPEAQLKNWDCTWCKQSGISDFVPYSFPKNARTDGFGFVGYSKSSQAIVIGYRGTEATKVRDWIVDLKSIKQTQYKNMTGVMVGKGFYNAYNYLQHDVLKAVDKLNATYPHYDILVTGHSLGGALATLSALDLVEHGYPSERIQVYTFGSPRVGNGAFSDYYLSSIPKTFRVVNGKDIVPQLPPVKYGFYHVPTEVWENPSGSLNFKVCNSSIGEDGSCSDSLRRHTSVYDHLHYYGIFEEC